MAQGEHVLGFSPDGKLFALINEHGILRIWDTQTSELKQEYTPNLHLVGPCTALTWILLKKPRKSASDDQPALYIALGTSNGGVILYSYALGKIERTFKDDGHTGRVSDIVYDDAGNLYTCGEDGRVLVWSLTKEKRLDSWAVGTEKLYSMAYVKATKNLLLASHTIKMYSTASKELVQSFTGHSSEVNLLSTVALDESTLYAITASRMERIICLWKLGKKGRNKSVACTLLMEDVAHCVTSHVNTELALLTVACVTRSGVIHVYHIPADSLKAAKPIKPKVTIEIASDNQATVEPLPIVAANMSAHGPQHDIIFGYGGQQFLVFEQVKPSASEKMQVLIRSDPKKMHSSNNLSKSKVDGKRQESMALKTVTPILNAQQVEYQTALTVLPRKLKPMEMPMESRLQNLNLSDGAPLQSQSKVQMLVQALHGKDKTLLRSVLCTDDQKTIQMTLQRLPVQYVSALFEELTELMQRSRINVEYSLRWLKTLAHTHSGQLMALGAEDLLDKVGPIIGIIEYRANCLRDLSKLNGRLQLLASQIKRNDDDDELNTADVLVYEDGASSGSEMDDEAKSSVSESEWDEDDDGEEDDEIEVDGEADGQENVPMEVADVHEEEDDEDDDADDDDDDDEED